MAEVWVLSGVSKASGRPRILKSLRLSLDVKNQKSVLRIA